MEKEIIVGAKTFKLREILAIELDDIDPNDRKAMAKALLTKGANLTEEQYAQMTIKEKLVLSKEIAEFNGLGDFQSTSNVKNN